MRYYSSVQRKDQRGDSRISNRQGLDEGPRVYFVTVENPTHTRLDTLLDTCLITCDPQGALDHSLGTSGISPPASEGAQIHPTSRRTRGKQGLLAVLRTLSTRRLCSSKVVRPRTNCRPLLGELLYHRRHKEDNSIVVPTFVLSTDHLRLGLAPDRHPHSFLYSTSGFPRRVQER